MMWTKKTIKRLSRSKYDKDKVLVNLFKEFKKEGGQVKNLKPIAIVTTRVIQEKSVTQRGDMLHTIDGTMQLIHADVADLNFFSKSAIAAKYCPLFADLFSSKVYTYRMKKKATCRKTRNVEM